MEANPGAALKAHLLCAGPCLITDISSFSALTLGSRYDRSPFHRGWALNSDNLAPDSGISTVVT